MLKLPEKIHSMIGNRTFSIDTVGMSNSQVICFDDMVLKIERKQEESCNEHAMMNWLYGKLPVPKILCSEQINNVNYLLMSRIEGNMLCSNVFFENPKKLIALISEGIKMLWKIDVAKCIQ